MAIDDGSAAKTLRPRIGIASVDVSPTVATHMSSGNRKIPRVFRRLTSGYEREHTH